MAIELTEAQHAVLQETKAADTPAEFQTLLEGVRPEMNSVVREVMEPSQAISTTLTELRDLYLTVHEHQGALAAMSYGPERRSLFRDSIRLLDTGRLWFGEGDRTGAYRVRTIAEVVQASRPWRARLHAFGAHAFALEPDIADQFADVNTTGSLAEETADLTTLLRLTKQHSGRLQAVGMPGAFLQQGQTLLDEAEGRDLLGILGLRNREEALTLRNALLTFATLLGREARAAGVNACYDAADIKRRFEAASFRNALRRLRPRRRAAAPGEAELDAEVNAEAPEGPQA